MCIHVHRELMEEIVFWHEQGQKNVSGVQMFERRTNRFIGSWVCFFDQPQSVAQAVHALRTWHPGDHIIDIGLVNEMREERDLPPLNFKKLPNPEPLVLEGLADNDTREQTRAVVTQWLYHARKASYATA